MKPLKFRKRDPMLARTKPPPASTRTFCGKCGKPGGMICAACAGKYREWVEWNTLQNGGCQQP